MSLPHFKMEHRDPRMSLDNSDYTRDGVLYRQQTLRGSEEENTEKFLLLGEDSERIRRTSWKSPRVITFMTAVNIVLFLASISVLLLSSRVRSQSDQDHWRATSYYCKQSTSFPFASPH
jgi:hypothetical protein